MSGITRREALAVAGRGAAGLALSGIPAAVLGREVTGLPIPHLVDTTVSGPEFDLVLQKGVHRFGPDLVTAAWGISSSYLGPTIRVRSGETLRPRVVNRLGEVSTLHWHGLMVPSDMDGGPHNPIEPDAHWAPELAIRQPPATTWFHPHPHGGAGRQTWLGLAGLVVITDGSDADLGLPVEYGLDDLPLVIQDRRFGAGGTLEYSPDVMDLMHGLRGDTILVNGAIRPTATVPAGLARLRVLNGANARTFFLSFSDARAFHVIAGDGGLLSEPVELERLVVASGERYELLVDFSNGKPVDLVTAPDRNGRFGPGMLDRLKSMVSTLIARNQPVMRFEPDSRRRGAVRRLPPRLARLSALEPQRASVRRALVLDEMRVENMPAMMRALRSGGPAPSGGHPERSAPGPANSTGEHGIRMAINGRSFAMDRIDIETRLGAVEVWEVSAQEMAHPFHVHGASFRILTRDGKAPRPEESGWKDVVLVEGRVELMVRFEQPASRVKPFMYHCHILEHEDLGMMGQYVVA